MDINFILSSVSVFLVVIILLVIILLVAKKYLSPSGNVKITINNDTVLDVPQGNSVMATLNENGIYLPSACGGKASCGQCKVQVLEGGGEILDSEKSHFTRKEIKEGWRLGCQCKVKGDLKLHVDESIMGVKEWECTVIGNRNVATFIKEFKVALPPGEHMDFEPGSYAQIRIPAFEIDYDRDIDKSRIATPPFKPKDQGPGFMDVNPGIASSYIFTLKPGDKVIMSGPYGEFRPQYGTGREMIWVGGGAGMAPLRAQIMHMLRTLKVEDREMHYFYGARAMEEIPFLDDFLMLEREHPNFHFHLALDRPDPKADAAGLKYTPGFVAPVMGDTYLKQHEAPEDCEYYLCGPPMMTKTVLDLLYSLGVEDSMIRFDNFGG